MLSARACAEAVSEGYAGGADAYMPKPFRSQELVDRVAARLSGADRQRTNQQQRDDELRLATDVAELDAALQAADSVPGILEALLDAPLASADAAGAVIGVLSAEENRVRFDYAGSFPTEFRDRYHVAELGTPIALVDVVNTGEPMIVTDTLQLPPRYHDAVQDTADTVRALVMHPLRGAAGRVIGVVGLLWPAPREFQPGELDLFSRTAEITAPAVDRVRNLAREHRVAVEFQERLLDLDRESTAGAVAAVYRPAGEAMRVGGDWYLVAPLDSPGRIGLSVGDVVGHGLAGAVVMSQLRAAIAATSLTEADPAAVMSVLDRYAAAVPGARCATVSYAVVDTDAATISYSCAGHPYPLLLSPEGEPRFLESGRRPPVAVGTDGPAGTDAKCDLPAGSVVLLYTDGLIERPGQTLDEGFARLLDTAAGCADLPVGDICAQLLDRMAPPGGYTDDVVVLALRPSHATARSFTTVLPAALDELHKQRHCMRDWLATIGVEPRRAADIVLAADEAVSNAIEHGSGCDPRRTVCVEAFVRGDTVSATVSDSGRWSADSSASRRSHHRGRGLTLISALADHVDTVRSAQGTRVTLRFDHALASELVKPGR
jgi:anti-sigma regulatory factor (Ser/Thr protein kinase)/GAF domain-containing protein